MNDSKILNVLVEQLCSDAMDYEISAQEAKQALLVGKQRCNDKEIWQAEERIYLYEMIAKKLRYYERAVYRWKFEHA